VNSKILSALIWIAFPYFSPASLAELLFFALFASLYLSTQFLHLRRCEEQFCRQVDTTESTGAAAPIVKHSTAFWAMMAHKNNVVGLLPACLILSAPFITWDLRLSFSGSQDSKIISREMRNRFAFTELSA
jgi:hypothetical protein